MAGSADLQSLGAKVASLSTILAAQLNAGKHPKPSFQKDGPASYPSDPAIQVPRHQLIDALNDLLLLATGASDYFFLHGGLFINHEKTTLDIMNQFDFFSRVPLEQTASYSEVAASLNIPEDITRRTFRYAFTMRIFAPDPRDDDRVMHTAFSAHMARNPLLRSWVGHALEEAGGASHHAAEALRKFNSGKSSLSQDLHETSFGLSWPRLNDGRLADYWSVGQDDPNQAWRAQRFAEAMQASVLSGVVQADEVVTKYDWKSLGAASIIDVGGSDGSLAALLARKHPSLRFTVQDLPRVEEEFIAQDYSDIADRIMFKGQDFFEPQPEKADVFLMKHVLHNWPDKYAVKILRNLVAGLDSGGHIIICDSVVPSEKEAEDLPHSVRKTIAAADMQMFVMLNSKERTARDWTDLAKSADPRLRVAALHAVPGAVVSLLDLVLDE
ncbi:hypothetical protein CKM354_000999900 [Cercospora kikuchii]|uniref:O-methyltransferase C-terminal domain-containing protein n=1 Tax=Cercospora kikuchii TaxID=84275 RepID=A0A9P3FGQ6_9PEZI|nr:uncharacterized protein CKM354_000999900 [Cercospora kikuchii]GIZ46893.1 hypothetical protein CKM354_000999900 [Cercospora kikuchii]